MPESLKASVRAAISNAYYDARNAGDTMETAADVAATAVMKLVFEHIEQERGGQEEYTLDGTGFYTLPDGTLMKRPNPDALDLQGTTSDRPGQ